MLHGTSLWGDNHERLGCLFTICIQSSSDTVPCSSFPKTTKRPLAEIPFLASLSTGAGAILSDPTYNNRFTLSQNCCLTYSIPKENPVQASQKISASPQQLMMSTGPCSYQIPSALPIIPFEITAIGYYCTNYGHVSRCHKAYQHITVCQSKQLQRRDRYREEERSHWPLCPSYLPSLPSTPILRVKSSDPKLTVNCLVMVAKPADINQSDFLLVYQSRLFFPVFPGLIIWPSCYSVSEALKNLIMVKCMSLRFTNTH